MKHSQVKIIGYGQDNSAKKWDRLGVLCIEGKVLIGKRWLLRPLKAWFFIQLLTLLCTDWRPTNLCLTMVMRIVGYHSSTGRQKGGAPEAGAGAKHSWPSPPPVYPAAELGPGVAPDCGPDLSG